MQTDELHPLEALFYDERDTYTPKANGARHMYYAMRDACRYHLDKMEKDGRSPDEIDGAHQCVTEMSRAATALIGLGKAYPHTGHLK